MSAFIGPALQSVMAHYAISLQALEWGSTFRPDLTLPTFAFGPAGKVAKASAPQVAWVFGASQFQTPAPMRGSRNLAGGVPFPQYVKSRWQHFEVHVWAPKNQFSPVMRTGSLQGHLSFPGSVPYSATTPQQVQALSAPPTGNFWVVQILVTTAGAVGTAQFKYSLDGGATFTAGVTTSLTGNVLGASGATVQFNGTLAAGDLFYFCVFPQMVADYSTGETMMETLVQSIHEQCLGGYELVDGNWSGQQGEEFFQQGSEFVFNVRLRTPVPAITIPAGTALAPVTSILQTDVVGGTQNSQTGIITGGTITTP